MSRLFLDYYSLLHEKSLDFFEEIISANAREAAPIMAASPMAVARERARLDLVEITAANEYIRRI